MTNGYKHENESNYKKYHQIAPTRRNNSDLDSDHFRSGYIELMKNDDNAFFLTLTFPRDSSDATCESRLRFFLLRLNDLVYGKHKRKKSGDFIRGFVVRERHYNHTLHYHCLFQDDGRLEYRQPFDDAIGKVMVKVKGMIRKVHDEDNGGVRESFSYDQLLTKNGVDLQRYYSSESNLNLEAYLTNCLSNLYISKSERSDNIGILDKDGVLFGNLNPSRMY
jgi:hypothetical protein